VVPAFLAGQQQNDHDQAMPGVPGAPAGGSVRLAHLAAVMTPGACPLEELAACLGACLGLPAATLRDDLAADPARGRLTIQETTIARCGAADGLDAGGGVLLLVVDQFEELFTACGDTAERTRFVAALTGLAEAVGDPVRVVLGIRADFLPHCAGLPALVAAMADALVVVGPMDSDGLRRVVTEPARRAGLRVDPALAATVLAEVHGEPGALPPSQTPPRAHPCPCSASTSMASGDRRDALTPP
jgi:hypothetical protein